MVQRKLRKAQAAIRDQRLEPLQFDSRLGAYATAAAAVCLGVGASVTSAEAEVIFTPAHTTFTHGAISIDLNHDGISDIGLATYTLFFGHDKRLTASGLGDGNGILGVGSSSYPPSALRAGYRIGKQGDFRRRRAPAVNVFALSNTVVTGSFANNGIRFLGLKFKINGEVHFGWAGLEVKAAAKNHWPGIETTLLGYAYESEAGKSILAGDTGQSGKSLDNDAEISWLKDSGSLAALARGRLAYRREETADGVPSYNLKP